MTSTGHDAWSTRWRDTLPTITLRSGPYAREPVTSSSTPSFVASAIAGPGAPSSSFVDTGTSTTPPAASWTTRENASCRSGSTSSPPPSAETASAGLSKQASSCSSLPSATARRVALSSARVASGRPSYATAMTFGGASVVPGRDREHRARCAVKQSGRDRAGDEAVEPLPVGEADGEQVGAAVDREVVQRVRGIAGQQDALVDALGVERLEEDLALPAQLLVELDTRSHADVGVHGRHLRVDVGGDHLRALGPGERDRRVDRGAGFVAAVVAGDVDEAHWRGSFTRFSERSRLRCSGLIACRS